MPYLLLVIGLLIGGFALYRFFLNATLPQIKAFFLVTIAAVLIIALFYMAVTGRLPAALGLLVALWPILAGLIRMWLRRKEEKMYSDKAGGSGRKPMGKEEALDILGLKEDATPEDIRQAYKKLMRKVHPDNEGSDWMAAKLNQARDFLLKEHK